MSALFGFTGRVDETLAEAMGAALAHRGALVGTHSDGFATCGYHDHWEPAVRKRLGAGVAVDGDHTLILAGRLNGVEGVAPSPAELLRAYLDLGPAFIDRLRGAFVLAVLDRGVVHLARDGAGLRTVYYGRRQGRFLFAVEPKAILEAPGFPRRLRPAAVAQYLTFSFIPNAPTMLEDVFELPAGTRLTASGDGEPVLHRYFRFEDVDSSEQHPEIASNNGDDWVRRFRTVFATAVARRLPQDETVGVFLSGGLDSSVVTAEVARQHDRPVRTWAIHFGEQYPNELEFARAVAERCGTEHEEVKLEPKQFIPRLRKMIWHLDDPIGDPITVPNFELAAHVSNDVRWVFNGEGGDPCFGGPKNIPMLLEHWYGGVERPPGFRERAYLASYRRAYDELERLLTPDFRRRVDEAADLEGVLTPFFEARRPARFLDKLAAINIRLKGAHLILPKVERMTAAWGLTPLAPLFDEDVVRFSFEMPPEMRLSRGVEKVVLKRAYEDALPAEVIARPKSGMRVPVHYWFQKEMRRYARSILSPRRVRAAGIFDPERVKQLLDYSIEEGPGRYGLKLWMLITFELWRRIVLEREAV